MSITALKLNPDIAEAHHNLGYIYLNQNRLDEAVTEFVTALKINPNYAEARHNLDICYEIMKTIKQ
jgi:Flp pilus assembly protein TadD